MERAKRKTTRPTTRPRAPWTEMGVKSENDALMNLNWQTWFSFFGHVPAGRRWMSLIWCCIENWDSIFFSWCAWGKIEKPDAVPEWRSSSTSSSYFENILMIGFDRSSKSFGLSGRLSRKSSQISQQSASVNQWQPEAKMPIMTRMPRGQHRWPKVGYLFWPVFFRRIVNVAQLFHG